MPSISGEWWTKPCGDEDVVDFIVTEEDDGQSVDRVSVVKRALDQAERFREKYVNVTFGLSYEMHTERWKYQHYCWLKDCVKSDHQDQDVPNHQRIVPKYLDEHVSEKDKNSIVFNDFLVNAYEALQKCAVGLEQVTHDMTTEFKKQFEEAKNQLKNVLCEMNTLISEAQASKKTDVTSSVMDNDIRNVQSQTDRDIRGWFIFMEYMNVLEYIIEMFDHFKQK